MDQGGSITRNRPQGPTLMGRINECVVRNHIKYAAALVLGTGAPIIIHNNGVGIKEGAVKVASVTINRQEVKLRYNVVQYDEKYSLSPSILFDSRSLRDLPTRQIHPIFLEVLMNTGLTITVLYEGLITLSMRHERRNITNDHMMKIIDANVMHLRMYVPTEAMIKVSNNLVTTHLKLAAVLITSLKSTITQECPLTAIVFSSFSSVYKKFMTSIQNGLRYIELTRNFRQAQQPIRANAEILDTCRFPVSVGQRVIYFGSTTLEDVYKDYANDSVNLGSLTALMLKCLATVAFDLLEDGYSVGYTVYHDEVAIHVGKKIDISMFERSAVEMETDPNLTDDSTTDSDELGDENKSAPTFINDCAAVAASRNHEARIEAVIDGVMKLASPTGTNPSEIEFANNPRVDEDVNTGG